MEKVAKSIKIFLILNIVFFVCGSGLFAWIFFENKKLLELKQENIAIQKDVNVVRLEMEQNYQNSIDRYQKIKNLSDEFEKRVHDRIDMERTYKNLSPLLYVAFKLDKKTVTGGQISHDMTSLKVFSSTNDAIYGKISENLRGIIKIKGVFYMYKNFGKFVRNVKAKDYDDQDGVWSKIKAFFGYYVVSVSSKSDEINMYIFQAQEAMDAGDFEEFARNVIAIKTQNKFAQSYISDCQNLLTVKEVIEFIYSYADENLI